jgi:hypothetical protein
VYCDETDANGRPRIDCRTVPYDKPSDQGQLVDIPELDSATA